MGTGRRAVRDPKASPVGIGPGEQKFAVVNREVARIVSAAVETTGSVIAGQFVSAGRCPVGNPQTIMARRSALEQHSAVESRETARKQAPRIGAVDAGQLVGACSRSIRNPQALVAGCV